MTWLNNPYGFPVEEKVEPYQGDYTFTVTRSDGKQDVFHRKGIFTEPNVIPAEYGQLTVKTDTGCRVYAPGSWLSVDIHNADRETGE